MEILKEKTHLEPEAKIRIKPQKASKSIAARQRASKEVYSLEREETRESHNQELGKRGEDAASSFLSRKGFTILNRNWSCPAGEVDIVAEEQETLVFIEVKTRSNCKNGFPEEAITAQKRKRYEKIASFYLKKHNVTDRTVRFDVISILAVAPERAFLRHHRDAFSIGE